MDGRFVVLGALACLSCRPERGPAGAGSGAADWVAEPTADLGEVVARVGPNPVFAEEVRAQSEHTGKPPREALEDLIRFHLLAERARERGLAAGVSSSDIPRSLFVQRLIERELEPSIAAKALSERELREQYERTRTTFVHPRLVRVALLSVYPRRGLAKEVALARARETAVALYDAVSHRPGRSPDDFFTIQQEPGWLARKVHFTRIWQGPDESFGPLRAREAAAIARLQRPGDTSGLLEDHGAYHIARYIEEKPASNRSFEEVRDGLEREYYPRWRRDRFERFAGRLLNGHRIEALTDRVLMAPTPL